jgi:hypothetical protein
MNKQRPISGTAYSCNFKSKTRKPARPKPSGPAAKLLQKTFPELQRLQERDQLVLLRGAESTVVVDHSRGLSAVAQNCIVPGK